MDVIDGIFPENIPEGGAFPGKKQGDRLSDAADGKSAKAARNKVADRQSLMEMFMKEKRLKEKAAEESGAGEATLVSGAAAEKNGSAETGNERNGSTEIGNGRNGSTEIGNGRNGSTEIGNGKSEDIRAEDAGSSHVKTAEEKELEAYEEERRLFYVGVTRAKERLFLFTINRKSEFVRELVRGTASSVENQEKKLELQIKPVALAHREAGRKKTFSQEDFRQFCNSLGEGLLVEHKKFGNGVIAGLEENWVVIQFEERARRFELRTLYENGLLKFR